MKRALFIVSDQGNGHRVRCGALAEELRGRGWECANLERDESGDADVLVIDEATDMVVTGRARAVVLVDSPGTLPRLVRAKAAECQPDLLVCGNAGVTEAMFRECGARCDILAGPDYALLRPEFREAREKVSRPWGGTFDAREAANMSGLEMAFAMVAAETVDTFGGMRALEAACARRGVLGLTIHPQNEGEALNAQGLALGREVDGFGCRRVADAIEAMFS